MASSVLPSSVVFTVRRCQPELVPPATPTPHELKPLSDIDDQQGLRIQLPFIHIYRRRHNQQENKVNDDPVKVLREALAQTLVYYYPFAGRLREGPCRKLMVDCNGEGVMFIQAEADVTLDDFGDDVLQPPFPCFQELLYNVPGSNQIVNSPLLLIQVTRLKCGGFILTLRLNHTMSDGAGLSQFMNAWAEIARGANQPSVLPVWHRELLMARNPPCITYNHYEFEQVLPNTTTNREEEQEEESESDIAHQSFFFGPVEIASLRRLVPFQCTTFDVIAACFWYCRTKALDMEAGEDVRLMCIVNARGRFNPPFPNGYYGNCFAYPAVVTTAGKLRKNPLSYTVELVRKAKSEVTEEYMHSVADLLVTKDRCMFTTVRSCIVSDLTRARFREVDFGWGEAVYGGVARGGVGSFLGTTYFVPHKNAKGEEGILLPICLPLQNMNRFVTVLNDLLHDCCSLDNRL